jgi:hypothetical protein
MILTEDIEVNLNARNISSIREYKKDDNLILGEKVIIPVELLSKGSHVRIKCRCDICGKEKEIAYQKYNKNINNGGYYSCSSKCSQNKVKNTSLSKYGSEYYMKTDEYRERSRKTNMSKYGSECYLTSDEGLRKTKEIILNKLGVDNPFKSKEIQDKIKKTNIKKWGVDNPSKSDFIKSKIGIKTSKVWNEKYKSYYKENHNLDIVSYIDCVYKIKCDNCGSEYDIDKFLLSNRILLNTEICTVCNKLRDGSSGYENELKSYISSIYTGEIIENTKSIISPYELDIFLPGEQIAIEFNGLYWHSDKYKDKLYHSRKYKMCLDRNIELIQVWQDDWLYKNQIIKSFIEEKILNNFNKIIPIELCDVKLIESKDANNFLEKNHIKGKSKSKINIALIYKEEIISLMSLNRIKSKSYILNRYCNKLGYKINDSFLNLLNYFTKNFNFDEIVTYHDNSLGFNNLYESIGFKKESEINIDYSYVISGIRKHKYVKKTIKNIDRDLLRIYDAGSYKFIKKN